MTEAERRKSGESVILSIETICVFGVRGKVRTEAGGGDVIRGV